MDDWERCVPWIKAALERSGGTHTIWDVWVEVAAGRAQFWPFERSAAVTQILTHPRAKVLRVWLAGGDLNELRDAISIAVDYGQRAGCDSVEIEGRPGWERVLNGFTKDRVVLRRRLYG